MKFAGLNLVIKIYITKRIQLCYLTAISNNNIKYVCNLCLNILIGLLIFNFDISIFGVDFNKLGDALTLSK